MTIKILSLYNEQFRVELCASDSFIVTQWSDTNELVFKSEPLPNQQAIECLKDRLVGWLDCAIEADWNLNHLN